MKIYHLFYLALFLILSCNAENKDSEIENNEEITSPTPSNTIKVFAQDQPGSEPKYFDMSIEKGLDLLQVQENNKTVIDEDDLVIGIDHDSNQIAIPLRYLSGFEVANFTFDNQPYLLTWCPIAGCSRVFNGVLDSDSSGFDFGMGLFNNNLIIVDRKTKSAWSQISGKPITSGSDQRELTSIPSMQCSWKQWKSIHPRTKVAFNDDTNGVIFPDEALQKPYYSKNSDSQSTLHKHHIDNLGIGIQINGNCHFIPLQILSQIEPRSIEIGANANLQHIKFEDYIFFFNVNESNIWIEDLSGNIINHTVCYQDAWLSFYPKCEIRDLKYLLKQPMCHLENWELLRYN